MPHNSQRDGEDWKCDAESRRDLFASEGFQQKRNWFMKIQILPE